MDADSLHLATIIIHAISIFGLITNIISIITIIKSLNLHTSFGILCAFLAANNCVVLVLYSIWYLLPDSGFFKSGSTVSKVVGMIGMIFWLEGVRLHILISFNRFVAIVYPHYFQRFTTARNTSIAATVALLIGFIQCSPVVLMEDIWFCYDREHAQWVFAPNETTQFYSFYFYYLSVAIELTLVLFLDVLTIINLRLAFLKNAVSQNNDMNAGVRDAEIRLFKQAFSQSVPLLITLIMFAFLTPQLSDDFAKFLSTTFVWHLAHGVDGLIIDIFHTRLNLFKTKKNDVPSSIAPSISFPLTSIA